MVSFPPCKINLGLNVLRKRSDGYHDIETCFYPVPWTDMLEIIPSKEFSFSVTGLPVAGREEDNLCVRAYRLMQAAYSLPPVRIHIHKFIPAGAGLGGGSSDGAWALRLLNDVFELKLSKDVLKQYASRLGSDCAFFIDDGPMMAKGRGEILSPTQVDLTGKYMAIVKPDAHVSTARAYAGMVPKTPGKRIHEILENIPIADWKLYLVNDFERTVAEEVPEIATIKRDLYQAGALYASMTGSGSAVYGIFLERPRLEIEEGVHKVVWLQPGA